MKKAFTLIEVIISIFIFSLITLFLYKSIDSLKVNNKNLKTISEKNKILTKITLLIKKDLILSKYIDKNLLKKNILSMITTNSIFGISKPKVIWKVLKEDNKLVRIEKINNIIKVSDTGIKCKSFKILLSKKEDKVLIFITDNTNKKIITQIIKNN